jgi:hypothetical protein
MVDITSRVLDAWARRASWELDALHETTTPPWTEDGSLRVEWDAEAGEEWGRLCGAGRILGFVWARGPLAIVAAETIPGLQLVLERAGIEVVPMADLHEPLVSVGAPAIAVLLRGAGWPDEVQPDRLSASDLWWATV